MIYQENHTKKPTIIPKTTTCHPTQELFHIVHPRSDPFTITLTINADRPIDLRMHTTNCASLTFSTSTAGTVYKAIFDQERLYFSDLTHQDPCMMPLGRALATSTLRHAIHRIDHRCAHTEKTSETSTAQECFFTEQKNIDCIALTRQRAPHQNTTIAVLRNLHHTPWPYHHGNNGVTIAHITFQDHHIMHATHKKTIYGILAPHGSGYTLTINDISSVLQNQKPPITTTRTLFFTELQGTISNMGARIAHTLCITRAPRIINNALIVSMELDLPCAPPDICTLTLSTAQHFTHITCTLKTANSTQTTICDLQEPLIQACLANSPSYTVIPLC